MLLMWDVCPLLQVVLVCICVNGRDRNVILYFGASGKVKYRPEGLYVVLNKEGMPKLGGVMSHET